MASIRVSKCFDPLAVIASGNSAIFLSLKRVTFFTSRKLFCPFFSIKKSNLVSLSKKTSEFILSLLNFLHMKIGIDKINKIDYSSSCND